MNKANEKKGKMKEENKEKKTMERRKKEEDLKKNRKSQIKKKTKTEILMVGEETENNGQVTDCKKTDLKNSQGFPEPSWIP